MKNYVIGALCAIILFLASVIYRDSFKSKQQSLSFPMEKNYFSEKESNPPSLRLFVFFSKNNCASCLEIIDALNELPSSYFKVVGVVPDNESKNIKEIRSLTGAIFPIEGQSKFKNFLPRYMPSIVGVTRKNEIFFILPGVPGEKDYLFKFLDEIYNRIYNYHTN